jgi:hypothetical protein
MAWREFGWLIFPALALLLNMPWGTFIRWAKEEAKSKKEIV